MISVKRRFLAVLSACGLAAGAAGYIESFSSASTDNFFLWHVPLFFGLIALLGPICVLEYPASRAATFALKGFARGLPNWVAPCSWLLLLIALGHFAWFAVHSGSGAPAILDGQYVLDARGHILRVLTQSEYFKLRAAEARMFETTLIYLYFTPLMYWWFPKTVRRIRPGDSAQNPRLVNSDVWGFSSKRGHDEQKATKS
jgi:hypothetical protein